MTMKWLQLLLGLGLGGYCLFLSFKDVSLGPLKAQFISLQWPFVILSFMGMFICQGFRATRWQRLLKPFMAVPFHQSFYTYSLGNLLNMVIPLRGGDILRAWIMGRYHPSQPRSSILATIVTERLMDLITFGLLLGSMLWIYPVPKWISITALILFLGSLGLAGILVILKTPQAELFLGRLYRLMGKILPLPWRLRFEHFLKNFLKGIAPLSCATEYGKFLFETIILWAGQTFFLYFLMKAFPFSQNYTLGIQSTLLMLALTTGAVSLPSSPSYAGTLHLMAVLSLEMDGVPSVLALSYAIALHGINSIITLILGIFSLSKLSFTQEIFKNFLSFKK